MRKLFASAFLLLAGCTTYRSYIEEDPIPSTVRWFTEEKEDDACVVAVRSGDGAVDFVCANCDENSLFRVASITKLMLEPVVDSLARDGLIDLSRPVTEYFKPNLPAEYNSVTLRELYDNRSGLPREFIDPWCMADVWTAFHCGFAGIDIYQDFADRDAFVAKLSHPMIRGDVRRRVQRYSNMGFALLIMAITDHLGVTVDQLVNERLVKPYGLKSTAFEPTPAMSNRLTRACSGALPWLIPRGGSVPDHRLGEVARDTGGIRTSASDLMRLLVAHLPRIRALAEKAQHDFPDLKHGEERVVGLFMATKTRDGRLVLFRHGMIYGGASFVGYDYEADRLLVVLRNVTSWPAYEPLALFDRLARE